MKHRDPLKAMKVQRRPGGAGGSVYITGAELARAMKGDVPAELAYRVIPWGENSVIVRFEAAA